MSLIRVYPQHWFSPRNAQQSEQGFQPRRLMIRPVGPGRAGVASPPVDRRFPLGQEGEQPVGRDGLGLRPHLLHRQRM